MRNTLRVALFFAQEEDSPEVIHTTVVDERFYGSNLRRLAVETYNLKTGKWEPVVIMPFFLHGKKLHTICRLNNDEIDRMLL